MDTLEENAFTVLTSDPLFVIVNNLDIKSAHRILRVCKFYYGYNKLKTALTEALYEFKEIKIQRLTSKLNIRLISNATQILQLINPVLFGNSVYIVRSLSTEIYWFNGSIQLFSDNNNANVGHYYNIECYLHILPSFHIKILGKTDCMIECGQYCYCFWYMDPKKGEIKDDTIINILKESTTVTSITTKLTSYMAELNKKT